MAGSNGSKFLGHLPVLDGKNREKGVFARQKTETEEGKQNEIQEEIVVDRFEDSGAVAGKLGELSEIRVLKNLSYARNEKTKERQRRAVPAVEEKRIRTKSTTESRSEKSTESNPEIKQEDQWCPEIADQELLTQKSQVATEAVKNKPKKTKKGEVASLKEMSLLSGGSESLSNLGISHKNRVLRISKLTSRVLQGRAVLASEQRRRSEILRLWWSTVVGRNVVCDGGSEVKAERRGDLNETGEEWSSVELCHGATIDVSEKTKLKPDLEEAMVAKVKPSLVFNEDEDCAKMKIHVGLGRTGSRWKDEDEIELRSSKPPRPDFLFVSVTRRRRRSTEREWRRRRRSAEEEKKKKKCERSVRRRIRSTKKKKQRRAVADKSCVTWVMVEKMDSQTRVLAIEREKKKLTREKKKWKWKSGSTTQLLKNLGQGLVKGPDLMGLVGQWLNLMGQAYCLLNFVENSGRRGVAVKKGGVAEKLITLGQSGVDQAQCLQSSEWVNVGLIFKQWDPGIIFRCSKLK